MRKDGDRPRIYPVFVPHAGCPHRCAFCNQVGITGHAEESWRAQLARMQTALAGARGGTRQVAFYGGSFTALEPAVRGELLAWGRGLIEAGLAHSLRASTRPDAVDEAVLAELVRAGMTVLELGAQSFDDEVLRRAGRGHTTADTVRAARLVREAGLELGLQLMIGLPADTPRIALESARRAAALGPDLVRVYPALVLRGAPLEDDWRAGSYRPWTLTDTVRVSAAIAALMARRGVPVGRWGLQASDGLTQGRDLLAGPYHPAFGQLVKAACYRALATRLSAAPPPEHPIRLFIHPHEVSNFHGQPLDRNNRSPNHDGRPPNRSGRPPNRSGRPRGRDCLARGREGESAELLAAKPGDAPGAEAPYTDEPCTDAPGTDEPRANDAAWELCYDPAVKPSRLRRRLPGEELLEMGFGDLDEEQLLAAP